MSRELAPNLSYRWVKIRLSQNKHSKITDVRNIMGIKEAKAAKIKREISKVGSTENFVLRGAFL
jgi:hypothetical protein